MEYRNKQLNFRVTESEYEVIKKRMKMVGISHPSAYLRKMAMNGYVINLDLSDLKEILRLVNIDSKNLNQIAIRANETGAVCYRDIKDLLKTHEEAIELLRDLYEKLASIKQRKGENEWLQRD